MNWWNIIGDLSNAVAAALAAYSIYITIKEQKNIRQYEKNKIIIDQNLIWYNEVAINDIIKKMSSFIDKSEQILDDCKKSEKDSLEKKLKKAYDSIKEDYKILNESIYLLKIFSFSLYEECNNSMQKILDLYSNTINIAIRRKYYLHNNNRVNIQNERVKMIKQLYMYKSKFVIKDE